MKKILNFKICNCMGEPVTVSDLLQAAFGVAAAWAVVVIMGSL